MCKQPCTQQWRCKRYVYLYVVSTLRLAAASSAGGIQEGKHVPETHLVHSNNPGSTRIFVFPSCWRPDAK